MRWISALLLGGLALTIGFSWRPLTGVERDIDAELEKVLHRYSIRPLPTRDVTNNPKYQLGRYLFFDSILSGPRSVSCSTCHLLRHGSSDGLARSIGIGGSGLGPDRVVERERDLHARNSPGLWNLDNNAVSALFWDGRVEMTDPAARTFRTPLGDALPKGIDNTLAAQALAPLVRPEEMLGYPGELSGSSLPAPHRGLPNEFIAGLNVGDGFPAYANIFERILARLFGNGSEADRPWQNTYRNLFKQAFPGKALSDASIADVANALSHFQEIAFATRDAPWDRYVAGDLEAIDINAKKGALVFFGKGKCAVCHDGPLFSDFRYHSVGVPHKGPGVDGKGMDLGRFHVTGREADKFKFRTPPLRNVTVTGPYFHNGFSGSLEDAIEQHLDPFRYANQYDQTGDFMMSPAEIAAISPVLQMGLSLTRKERNDLLAFLQTLEDVPSDREIEAIVPDAVPSGLPIAERF